MTPRELRHAYRGWQEGDRWVVTVAVRRPDGIIVRRYVQSIQDAKGPLGCLPCANERLLEWWPFMPSVASTIAGWPEHADDVPPTGKPAGTLVEDRAAPSSGAACAHTRQEAIVTVDDVSIAGWCPDCGALNRGGPWRAPALFTRPAPGGSAIGAIHAWDDLRKPAAPSSGPVEVIAPDAGEVAPDLSELNGYMLRGAKHHGLCGCTDCAALKRSHRVDVLPFAVLDPAMRAKGEPTATIEYGGVRILIGLTFLRNVSGALRMDAGKSFYCESMHVCASALDEIERRMWRSFDSSAPFTRKAGEP